MIVGNNENIARLTNDPDYGSFAKLSELKGYQNMYLFESDDVYEPYYSLLLSHPKIRGRFQPERGQGTQIKDIEGVKQDRNSGDVRLVLAVDLSKMLIDEDYLTDIRNYKIESDDKITIEEIRPITKADITPAEKKYNQDVDIKLMNHLPAWVAASSSDDDTTVDSKTTFGLKYLLQGIYNSYQKKSDGEPYYFELELEFKR